jgi:hypothetical protein
MTNRLSMIRTSLRLGVALCLSLSSLALAAEAKTEGQVQTKAKTTGQAKASAKTKAPRLSAAEIVKKHVSARGGVQAWQSLKTLSLSGKMEAGTGDSVARSMSIARPVSRKTRRELASPAPKEAPEKQVQLPFKLARERPNRSRLEIEFAGKTAVQVYDGTNGWKLRPFLNRQDVEPFTAEEAKVEAENPELEGLLIGYQAKGTKVEAEGVEKIDGRDAYKLKVTTKAGAVRRVWIDAKTFLDVQVEGAPRRMDGKVHRVFVHQRDFRSVQGLKIPFVLETVVDGYAQSHKIFCEKVAVNPKLDAATFAKPKA